MYFQLLKLILWPVSGTKPRVVEFERGVVNVISGASKTGKSAVIPIVDYCLGAGKCAIPVGVIREKCSWFGIVIETVEGQKLLARREPGDQQNTGDMYVIEASEINVPEIIEGKNSKVDAVKASLDRLSGLSTLEFEPDSDNAFKSRPSFRDLAAFMFQPQNIVANPDVLFFKADTTEHREKLKTIFPYILGAITPAVLRARHGLEQLARQLRRKENELKSLQAVTDNWIREGSTWLQQAIELGLSPVTAIPLAWADIVDQLRIVVSQEDRVASPSIEGIDATMERLKTLRAAETEASKIVTEHRQRLNELRRLRESSDAYGDAMRLQRDRLSLAEWLRARAGSSDDLLARIDSQGGNDLLALCATLEDLQIQLRTHPFLSNSLDSEQLRQRSLAEDALGRLNDIRQEIRAYEATSDEAKQAVARANSVQRFIGRLEQALELFDQADTSSPLRSEIDHLKRAIGLLEKQISEGDIRRRQENALNTIQGLTSEIVPQLDAEWPEAPLRLDIKELTVRVTRGVREDFLWEIGSGANWLAYHVAMTLALQKYFLNQPHHPVPALLIYDQPSQVYFPKRMAGSTDKDNEEDQLRDQDIQQVRKVFSVLSSAVTTAKSKLQVIVLDHAHADVWGDIPRVTLKEEWRGSGKLVPIDWV